MATDFERFELYYDSSVDNPKEDPDALADRIEDLAERRGIEYDLIDLADEGTDRIAERRRDLVSSVRAGREYVVDGRVFSDETFGQLRPVLVAQYADEKGIDLYPHQSDADAPGLTGIGDFLNEVDPDVSGDGSAHAELAEEDDGADDRNRERESNDRLDASDAPVERRTVLAGMAGTGAVVGGTMLVGLKNVPVVGALFDCGPGETKIGDITDGGLSGSTVQIRGVIDYSLDNSAGFTAFQLDGQTGTIPVYLAGEPERELEFDECLHIEGTVTAGEDEPVDGPVVSDATVTNE